MVNAGALRIGNGVFGASATNPILVASGAELQYSGNGGSKFNDPIQGAGDFNLLAGTVQLTGTNIYTGGTNIQIGATFDVTDRQPADRWRGQQRRRQFAVRSDGFGHLLRRDERRHSGRRANRSQ